MTVRRLRGEIHTAVADGRLDLREERRIEGTTGDALSNAEARELGALYDRLTTTRPGTAERPYATQTSFEALRRLFAENGQPYGPNRSVVVEQLRRYFEVQDLGAPLATAPRTAGLPELVLRDARPTDGTRETVLLNAASKRAWLRVDGGGRARPEPQWFGPFDLTKPPVAPPDRPNVQPFPAGLSVDRFGQIGRAARDEIRGGRLAFDDAELPVGPRLAELGVLHADRRTGAAFRVFLVDDGRAADTLDRYYVRREIAGEPSRVAGPVVVPPFVDPYGDGQLTFPGRAKNLYYRLAFDEHLAWRDGAPDREIHLARGTRVTDVDPYFVIPRNPDGSDADPDGATQVYFRHRPTGKWSGPHEL